MEVRIVQTLWQGDHLSWMMSRHIEPSLQQAQVQSVPSVSATSVNKPECECCDTKATLAAIHL